MSCGIEDSKIISIGSDVLFVEKVLVEDVKPRLCSLLFNTWVFHIRRYHEMRPNQHFHFICDGRIIPFRWFDYCQHRLKGNLKTQRSLIFYHKLIVCYHQITQQCDRCLGATCFSNPSC